MEVNGIIKYVTKVEILEGRLNGEVGWVASSNIKIRESQPLAALRDGKKLTREGKIMININTKSCSKIKGIAPR